VVNPAGATTSSDAVQDYGMAWFDTTSNTLPGAGGTHWATMEESSQQSEAATEQL